MHIQHLLNHDLLTHTPLQQMLEFQKQHKAPNTISSYAIHDFKFEFVYPI